MAAVKEAVSVANYEGGFHNPPQLRMYRRWNLCTQYLLARHMRVNVGDLGLCCSAHVTSFKR